MISRLAAFAVFALLALGFATPAAANSAGPLVSPQWLFEHQKDADVVVLDIRSAIDGGGEKAYLEAHIPGSVHTDYDKGAWRVMRNNVPFMLPSVPELDALIGDREPIVLHGRLPGMGSVSRTIIRIGDDNRAPLDALCNKLIAAGGACVVLRNDRG